MLIGIQKVTGYTLKLQKNCYFIHYSFIKVWESVDNYFIIYAAQWATEIDGAKMTKAEDVTTHRLTGHKYYKRVL